MMAMWLGRLISALLLGLCLLGGSALAQGPAEPTPEQVKSLLHLLADPVVKGWIERETAGKPAAPTAESTLAADESGIAAYLEGQMLAARSHVGGLVAAAPGLPGAWSAAVARMRQEHVGWFPGQNALLLAAFASLGLLVEWLVGRATSLRRKQDGQGEDGTVRSRVRTLGQRLLAETVGILAFALGSVGGFMLFDWPPAFRRLFMGFLAAAVIVRLTLSLCRFLFAPGRPEQRVVPMDDGAARLLTRWITVFVAVFALGWILLELLASLGMDLPSQELLSSLLGLVLLAIALRIVWRPTPAPSRSGRLLGTLWAVAIWLLWVLGSLPLMWTLLVVGLVPALVKGQHSAVRHLFRPAGAVAPLAEAALPTSAILVDRGLRFVLLACGVAILVWGWGFDLGTLSAQESPAARLAHGFLNAIVILLVADLLWKLAHTAIDRQLAQSAAAAGHGHAHGLSPEEARRRARMRTLLPILRIVLFVVLAATAILMALSSMGVQIAPLIAGAGVLGVAVGFGSQTLVKDIISGMFYLLDDAFRVGEYIVSGNYRGTVEGFSLRSIKLRHHRGPVFTVPFGMLGAVQNLSRDWVIDKVTVGVTYDTDLDKVKKVVKQVSKEIMADPELAKNIIEPLKSQGVAEMGDYAIQIRMKFMAKPGEQFVVRRVVYDKIKKAFDANGIEFAFPTVTVAGGAESVAPAVARSVLAKAAGAEQGA
jgi:small-conductance mechanosensitive channel